MLSCGNSSSFYCITADEIAKLCFIKFKSLPKTGKPTNREWAILSGIIMYNSKTQNKEVVSLGCGTKCIGKSKLCSQGLTLNDSHAEVLARRGLLRYFYHQLNKALKESAEDSNSIFIWLPKKRKFKLKDEISLHFVSTQTPCGDACIVVDQEHENEPNSKKRKMENENFEETNCGSVINTVYTGAKLIGIHTDAMEQLVGAVRTKPGRGERTLSMSCSDKLAKWQIMGLQGALLNILIDSPIYFDTLNFWGQNDTSTLERAIWKRFQNDDFKHSKYRPHIPKIRICSIPNFEFVQNVTKQPSPNGLVWCAVTENLRPFEISVNGKRQGITSKRLNTPQAALNISKFYLLKEFVNIIKIKSDILTIPEEELDCKSYIELKLMAKEYQNAWSDVKRDYFKQWSQKPSNILKFSIESVEHKNINNEN